MQIEKPFAYDRFYGDFLSENKFKRVCDRLFPTFYKDVVLLILQDLNFKDLGKCSVLNHDWCVITRHYFAPTRAVIYPNLFSPEDWNYYAQKKIIPYNQMRQAFRSLSPLVDTVSNIIAWMYEGFSIIQGGLFLKEFYPDNEDQGYTQISSEIVETHGKDKVIKAYWVIVSRLLIPESLDKSCYTQKFLLEKFKTVTNPYYKFPDLSEMIVAMTAEWMKFDKLLFDSRYTRCNMYIENKSQSEVIIAMFDDGIYIYYVPYYFNRRDVGLAAVKTFSNLKPVFLLNRRYSANL